MDGMDLYISSNGYLIIPEYGIKYLINLNESSIPSMPEATEATVRVAGRDGDIVLNTTYEPISFSIVCYTDDNLTPEEKVGEKNKINSFLNLIKRTTVKMGIEEDSKYYDVKYAGALTTVNYPAHVQFTIPLKTSASFAKAVKETTLIGTNTESDEITTIDEASADSNTIERTGAIITIEGPAQTPKISLNDEIIEFSQSVLEGNKFEIDTNNSTVIHVGTDGSKTNAIMYSNHVFPKIKKGKNALKVISGIEDASKVSVKWHDLKL